jgi:uncharacterized OsmC-like protein
MRPTLEQHPYPLAFVAAPGTPVASAADDAPDRSALRCEIMGLGDFQKEGLVTDLSTGRSWRLAADEGIYLRGTDLAPAPLMHWGAGLHADVTSRIAGAARHRGAELTGLRVTLTQGFGSQGSFARGEALGLVGELRWTVEVESAAPEEQVEAAVTEGLRRSPAHAALLEPTEGTFALYTNGRGTPVVGVPQSEVTTQVDPFRRHAAPPAPKGDTVSAQLLTRQPATEVGKIGLTDDQTETIHWHVQVSGNYQPESRLTASTVSFPGTGASSWTLLSDETGCAAPSPLAYFSIGTAFCYHTQLCRYAKVRRMAVSNPRLVQSSDFRVDAGSAVAEPLDTHLYLDGSVTEAQTASLLTAAANTCYAHRALSANVVSSRQVATVVS